jgi:hypothetical protein
MKPLIYYLGIAKSTSWLDSLPIGTVSRSLVLVKQRSWLQASRHNGLHRLDLVRKYISHESISACAFRRSCPELVHKNEASVVSNMSDPARGAKTSPASYSHSIAIAIGC